MVTPAEVREVALSLPEVTAGDALSFSVRAGSKDKSLCWTWNERVHPKKARVPNPAVLAIRVPGEVLRFFLEFVTPIRSFRGDTPVEPEMRDRKSGRGRSVKTFPPRH